MEKNDLVSVLINRQALATPTRARSRSPLGHPSVMRARAPGDPDAYLAQRAGEVTAGAPVGGARAIC